MEKTPWWHTVKNADGDGWISCPVAEEDIEKQRKMLEDFGHKEIILTKKPGKSEIYEQALEKACRQICTWYEMDGNCPVNGDADGVTPTPKWCAFDGQDGCKIYSQYIDGDMDEEEYIDAKVNCWKAYFLGMLDDD